MANFRSLDSIILSALDYIRVVQPDADVKPGTVFRDVSIESPALELSKLYVELRNVANLQSYSSASGTALDRLGANFSVVRGQGAIASGVVVFTTTSLDSDISIPANTLLSSKSGVRFKTVASTGFVAANSTLYRANATRLRSGLDSAGIADQYALEVAVQAVSAGTTGNIGKFSLVGQQVAGISNITNLESFTGGSNSETDASYRSRILSVFAGSSIGTALGYINTLRTDSRVIDVLPVEPGDPLMTRDGTQISTNSAGESIVIQPGTGGKVDLYVQGTGIEQNVESYIYRDRSGRSEATNSANDFVLGQRGISTLLNFQQRRRQAIRNGQLPLQPVLDAVSVIGSSSGANFIQAFTDDAGNMQGNYELVSDTGGFGGSPFGFDKIKWISNDISIADEVLTKGVFNGQDSTAFTDINQINQIHQNIVLRSEIATISSSDRSLLSVAHTPVLTIDRVFNVTTGERYVVAELNPGGTAGEPNTTGTFRISGNTLPIITDIVEVSYLWNPDYDSNIDYDNLKAVSPFRTVQDSIDWGYSNRIILEENTVTYSIADGYTVVLTHPASRVLDVNVIAEETVINNGGKVVVSSPILNIVDIKNDNNQEIFNTTLANGSFSGSEITLPTDSISQNTESANVRYNATDLFSPDGYDLGTFNGNVVSLPDGVNISAGSTVFINYIADLNTLLPTIAISSLPAVGNQNTFTVSNASVGTQPVTNIYSGSNIERNLRFAPSYLRMSIQGIPSRGRLTLAGTSFTRIEDIITITSDGLTVDLRTSLLNKLGLSTIPSTGFIGFLSNMERVTVSDGIITSTDFTFDILNYQIKDITYANGTATADNSLTSTQIQLSNTEDNLDNLPTTGEKIHIVYYFCDSNQTESLIANTPGIYFSKYKYAFVSSVSVASGFTTASGTVSGNITVTNANQPTSSSSYFISYDYVAPKEGERITITYNYNKLITDATFAIERARPITADVLIKQASKLEVDVSLNLIVSPEFEDNAVNVQQALEEALATFVTATGLNTTLDSSDIINASYQVAGVDRVIITKFNTSGLIGIRKSISSGRNQYIVAGTIAVTLESR